MSSADSIRLKAFRFSLCLSRKVLIAASSSPTLRWTSRLIWREVDKVKKRLTWFNHELPVGVRCTCKRGRLASQSRIVLVLGVALSGCDSNVVTMTFLIRASSMMRGAPDRDSSCNPSIRCERKRGRLFADGYRVDAKASRDILVL